jgi:hypothetical protein
MTENHSDVICHYVVCRGLLVEVADICPYPFIHVVCIAIFW